MSQCGCSGIDSYRGKHATVDRCRSYSLVRPTQKLRYCERANLLAHRRPDFG